MFYLHQRSNSMKASGRTNRAAFSLLEVIVAMSLGMVLLGSVWMMFSLLGRRQEISMREADRNQVTRSLHQQFTRDLMNLTAVEIGGNYSTRTTRPNTQFRPGPSRFPVPIMNPTTPDTSEPIVALQGDSGSLTLEVFVEPHEANRLRTANNLTGMGSDGGVVEGPATKRVVYEMGVADLNSLDQQSDIGSPMGTDIPDGEMERVPVPMGLVRYESVRQYELLGGSSTAQQPAIVIEESDWEGLPFAMPPISPPQQVLLREHVADIVALRFSYFDGQTWFSSWHSQDRKSLPMAVRAEFRFASPEKLETDDGQVDRGSEASTEIPLEIDIAMETEQSEDEVGYDIDFIVLLLTRPSSPSKSPLPTPLSPASKSGEEL